MDKINKFIKNNCIILMFIIMFITTIIFAYCQTCTVSDELWNFMNVQKSINGFSLYGDANCIVTPLFFAIGGLILKIFGQTIIAFRLYNVIICMTLLISIYNLFNTVTRDKLKSLVFTPIISIICFFNVSGGANYNLLAIVFVVLGIIIYIKNIRKENKYNYILQGLIIFLIFITKQNIGFFYVLANIIIDFIIYPNKINAFLNLSKKAIVFIILTVIMLLIMYKLNILYGFIEYCFMGISEFTSNLSLGSDILIFFRNIVIVISVVVLTIVFINKQITDRNVKKEYIVLLTVSLCMLGFCYPIFNSYHIYISSICLFITALCVLNAILDEAINEKMYILAFILICIIFIGADIYKLKQAIDAKENIYTGFVEEFQYTFIFKEEQQEIYDIYKYMNKLKSNGISAFIFSKRAAFYIIPSKTSNGYFDLPFKGNFGAKSEEDILKEIDNMKGKYILIVKDEEDMLYQESTMIRKYIIDNYQKIDEVSKYYVYKVH